MNAGTRHAGTQHAGTPAASTESAPVAPGTAAPADCAAPDLCGMSVNEMIAATPLAPILDRPVCEVLASLGLPTLPEPAALPPLPGLPALPPLDLGALVKPLTDLLGGFGTGDLGGAGQDPSQVFSGLSSVLETSISLAMSALDAADQLWAGQAATAATAKGMQASTDAAALSVQGTGISVDIQAAAGIVAAGAAAVQGVIAATVTKICATLPIIMTPPGQGLVVAFVAEGLAEASAIVAATRAELLGPTGHMTANGVPVPVTGAPVAGAGVSPFALAGSVLQAITPVLGAAAEIPSALAAPLAALQANDGGGESDSGSGDCADVAETQVRAASLTEASSGAVGGLGAGGLGVGAGAAAGAAGVSAGLAPAPSAKSIAGAGLTEPAAFTGASPTRPAAALVPPIAGASAPLAAAGATRGAGGPNDDHACADYLVSADYGRQVVGELGDAAPAVFGDDPAPPVRPLADIELRLVSPDGAWGEELR